MVDVASRVLNQVSVRDWTLHNISKDSRCREGVSRRSPGGCHYGFCGELLLKIEQQGRLSHSCCDTSCGGYQPRLTACNYSEKSFYKKICERKEYEALHDFDVVGIPLSYLVKPNPPYLLPSRGTNISSTGKTEYLS